MSEIAVSDAAGRLPELIEQVASGDEVMLTRDGQIVAKLVPATSPSRVEAIADGFRAIRESIAARGESFTWEEIKAWRDEGRR